MSTRKPALSDEPMLHIGLPTFMHMPFVKPKNEDLREARVDVAVLGAPLEMAPPVGLPGASLGPRAIRLGSESLISYNAELDVDINDHFNVADCGDVHPLLSNVIETHNKIQLAVSEILKAESFPIVLGGDHSITIPCIRAFHEHFKGNIGIIHFDSHYDTWDTVAGFRYGDASPIARALELSRIKGKNIVQIGVRGDVNELQARRKAEEAGIKTFYRHMVFRRGITDITKEALELASDGAEAIYLTFDIDCLDASCAPATSIPAPGGLSTIEVIESLRTIAKTGILKFFDVVEVGNPATDPNNITGRAAATIIAESLAAMALHKKSVAEN